MPFNVPPTFSQGMIGIDYKDSLNAAATGAFAGTRAGNVITANAVGALIKATFDAKWTTGPALAIGTRVFLPFQAAKDDNGAYYVSDMGSAGTPGKLTRTQDADTSDEVTSGVQFPITEGTFAGLVFELITPDPIILNTTLLTFVIAGAAVLNRSIAANGISNGLVTDGYGVVSFTDTSAADTYQAIAMGAKPGQSISLIIKDASYGAAHATAYGAALGFAITIKCLAGKKLNNVVNGTAQITTSGGSASFIIDENDDMHQLGGL